MLATKREGTGVLILEALCLFMLNDRFIVPSSCINAPVFSPFFCQHEWCFHTLSNCSSGEISRLKKIEAFLFVAT
jgi:hypothetical protein